MKLKFTRKDAMGILTTVVVIYLVFLAFMYFKQGSMIFVPMGGSVTPMQEGVPDMKVIDVTTKDGLDLKGWYRPPANPGGLVMVFFHGNAGSLQGRGHKSRRYVDAGYGFLYAEYRGFTGNPGVPSEQGLYDDARAYIAWLDSQGIKESQLVFYGESLGTGVAVKMASEHPGAAALILESPFTSMTDVVKVYYPFLPVQLLLKYRFSSLALASGIHMPTLVLHGELDNIVPFKQGKALYDAFPGEKEFADFPLGTHLNLFDVGAESRILAFLQKHTQPITPHPKGAAQ